MGTEWSNRSKTERRRAMAAVRDALPSDDRVRMSERLCANVEREVLAPLRSRLGRTLTVGAYAAFRSEADPYALVRTCWEAGDTVAAPLIRDSALEWRIVREPDDWRTGKWSVPEPDPSRTAALPADRAPDAVLVPGLAFHRDGGRLGYGGGYYDRLFAAESERGNARILWIGFALSPQLVTEPLPMEPHDLALDAVATDEGIIWLKREGR
ncbi:5-formyltetrahydrofolate cyclo-ligase [Cohnella sp. CFH 77786]|uniref:5-formyltetrahydrofolate cyclo-ligase n=1 Tax=Cohnella sp. CFH 77786 TaxID=2662265 RepID=UPI001C61037B|nr:5-formyltetrahydrofolate cyclo-ligase [Cohnella sp. CFH 77786]